MTRSRTSGNETGKAAASGEARESILANGYTDTMSENSLTNPLMRSGQELFLAVIDMPLYAKFELRGNGTAEIKRLRSFSGKFDKYCPPCKKSTIWTPDGASIAATIWRQERLAASAVPSAGSQITAALRAADDEWHVPFSLRMVCERIEAHRACFYFEVAGPNVRERLEARVRRGQEEKRPTFLLKIGQYPSLADFQMGDVAELEDGMTEQQHKEFVRAITTGAHGFSVAACVHYRRVFESFLKEARDQHMSDERLEVWPDFDTAHMEDKIKLVAGRLPAFLSEHPHLYKLLSVGVHELTEEECADELPVLREAIELIVRDRINARRAQKQRQQVSKHIAQALNKHKGN